MDYLHHNFPKNQQEKKKSLKWLFLGAIIFFLIASFVFWVYWTPKEIFLKKYFPALIVNGEKISLAEFDFYQKGLSNFLNLQGGTILKNLHEENLKNRLVTLALERQIAKKRKIKVSKEELESFYNEFKSLNPDFEELLAKNFGWRVSDFQNYVLRSIILEDKLRQNISDFQILLEEERKKARVWQIVKGD